MRTSDKVPFQSPVNQSGPTTITTHRPGIAAFPPAARAPATFYQAPHRRDFFQETAATHPNYSRPGMPRPMADYGGGYVGHRPYVSKYTVPPRY